MERSKELTTQPPPADEKPPSDKPISEAWNVFSRMALPKKMPGDTQRYMQHAFYAGARATFNGVIDAMREADEGVEGEKRFEAIEREIIAYWAKISGQALIAPGGRA